MDRKPKMDKANEKPGAEEKVLASIAERKVASVEKPLEKAEAPVINVVVDTDAIASQIDKLLNAQTASTTANAEIIDSITKINQRLDSIPTVVSEDDKATNVFVAGGKSRDAKAALRDFEYLFEQSQKAEFDGGRGYGQLLARDTRELDKFVAANREVLRQAMQEHGYKHGLFRAAATTLNDIPASFSGYLSSIMRQTPRWGKIWWQFLNPVIRLGNGVGNQVDVPRLGKINRPIDPSDWELSGNGFSTSSQPILNGYEKVIVARYGMGEPGKNNDPVGVDEYYMRHSILDLEAQVQAELGDNYNEFRELITYREYANTNVIRYYKASTKTIETAATALTTGDDGIIEYEALVRLRAHLNGELGVIPWPDGCYVLVSHPNAIVDLEIELNNMGKPVTRMNIEELTNMIQMVNTAVNDVISGYRFTVGGFHIFTHENLPPDPNYMKSTTGTAPNTRNWYDNIAFGPMAVCELITMPAEIRQDEMRQFGTMNRWIWLMYGKYQAIERGTTSTGAGLGQRSQIVKFRSGRP